MTQFKDKANKGSEEASVGLYTYPVLMAADILLYKACYVPVGEDQKQHLELARDIAHKFNVDYYDRYLSLGYGGSKKVFFPVPEALLPERVVRIMSLRDGTKKMSKSDVSDYSRINLDDSNDLIIKKLRKAKTDPLPLPSDIAGLRGRAEVTNLVNIYSVYSEDSHEDILREFGGSDFSRFKSSLTELIISKIKPVRDKIEHLSSDKTYIDGILRDGADRANLVATKVMSEVKDIVGFFR